MDKQHRTRKEFEDAFWQLNEKKGIERITVRELSERAGYNRTTFYLHYADVYALREDAENDLLAQMAECVSYCSNKIADTDHTLEKTELIGLMLRVLSLYERNRRRIVILLGPNGDTAFVRELENMMKQIPVWRVCDPSINTPDEQRALLLEQAVAGVLAMIRKWLENPNGVSATELLHLIYDSAIKRTP